MDKNISIIYIQRFQITGFSVEVYRADQDSAVNTMYETYLICGYG